MANRTVFCNTPWYEAHVYWDGSLGVCCQETGRLYENTDHNRNKYNLKNMGLLEWFNSEPVREFRNTVLSSKRTPICNRCYTEECHSGTSRRHRANQKSVIFTRAAFDASFEQSPGHEHFQNSLQNQGYTNTYPIDLHIDLGNYCNLACKMCTPQASTKIAAQLVKWHQTTAEEYLGVDWTKDSRVWRRFLNDLMAIPKLKNIHIMGGETILQPRFEELLDWFIHHERFDISWSFVTNGTHYNSRIVEKLKNFQRAGIEVSIETATIHNDYIRQGTNTEVVLNNLSKYAQDCENSNITLTIRPAISLLSVGYYHTLLDYCVSNKLLIKSLLVTDPNFLDVRILPNTVRQQYLSRLEPLQRELASVDVKKDYNESDPNLYLQSIKVQIQQVESLLTAPRLPTADELLEQMVKHCRRWDQVYGFNAVEFYPEFDKIWTQYEYHENLRRHS